MTIANINEHIFVEDLLKENPGRFVLFPIQHKDIWDFYYFFMGYYFKSINHKITNRL